MGLHLIDPEIEAELAANRRAQTLRNVKNFGMFALNPMGFVIGKGLGYLKDKFFGGNDGDGGGDGPNIDPGTFTKESIDQSFAGEEGPTGGSTATASASDFSDDTAGTPFEYGGRVGYSGGGLTEYEVFKLGELGYNTKGGTVLEPFGGIKVLKDILRVNKYAYGGIVGMYR